MGGPTTWVKLLAAIDWLVDRVKKKEEEEPDLGEEDNVRRPKLLFKTFVIESLREFYVNKGERQDALELQLAESWEKDLEWMCFVLRSVNAENGKLMKETNEVKRAISEWVSIGVLFRCGIDFAHNCLYL